jgi:hypothetical protein
VHVGATGNMPAVHEPRHPGVDLGQDSAARGGGRADS